jgi:predicted metal-dependent TIM-barrel fold hydrolase
MRIIDPHVHMYSRTTDDYEMMAVCGIEAVVEPSFWLGSDRKHAGSFFDYFDHISQWEPVNRAAKRGIRHFCTIGLNPKEADNLPLAREVLAALRPYFERPTVVGMGEVGLNNLTANEETVLAEQFQLARELGLPVLVHTPHNNKLAGTLRILALAKEARLDPARVDMDHNTEETIRSVLDAGYWAGITMYPRTKCTPQRARDMVERFGAERILLNSSADWEWSDPLAVPKCARLMLQTGFSRAQVAGVVWDNPYRFLAQSGHFRKVMEPVYAEREVPAASAPSPQRGEGRREHCERGVRG